MPTSQLDRVGVTTPARIRSSAAMQTQLHSKVLAIAGRGVESPQRKAAPHALDSRESANLRASKLHLVQDLQDLRSKQDRFMISPRGEDAFDRRETSSRETKMQDNVGIKTLISITHHTNDQFQSISSNAGPHMPGLFTEMPATPHGLKPHEE